MKWFTELVNFVKAVAGDQRIPSRDKKVVLGLLAYILSPVDLIPDWIPIFGQLDDLIALAIILDYFFEVLDQEILLSHFPWQMKTYVRLRKASRFISYLAPRSFKRLIWKFEVSPYKK